MQLSREALQQANQVNDEVLTLIKNINAITVPEINLDKLKTDAMNAIQEVIIFFQNVLINKYIKILNFKL